MVAVGTDGDAARWSDVVAAAADGFDILLVSVPADVPPATVRKLAVRLRQRDVVTIVLGDPGSMAHDGIIETEASHWSGLGDGHGHLRARDVAVQVGRRLPGRRRCRLELPA